MRGADRRRSRGSERVHHRVRDVPGNEGLEMGFKDSEEVLDEELMSFDVIDCAVI